MLVNDDGRVLGDITGYFLRTLLVYKASKATHVNVITIGHGIFYHFEECFNGGRNIRFFNPCLIRNF